MKYIAWKSRITQKEGHGKMCLTPKDAEKEVKKLNNKYPKIHHWTEECKC